MIKLNLGCGVGLLGGFTNVDNYFTLEELEEGFRTKEGFCQNTVIEPEAVYVKADIMDLPFEDNYADYVIMNNVIEHFPMRKVISAMAEVYRVMKPGALAVIETPDFNGLARLWTEEIGSKVGTFTDFQLYEYIAEVVYGNQCGEGEYHRCPMTPDFLNCVLKVVGFEGIVVKVYPMHGEPPKGYDGYRYKEDSIMRTDTLLAEARKPEGESL